MTFRLQIIYLLLSTLFFSSPVKHSKEHPLKLTSSEIKYDAKTKTMKMECKVFIDDFAPVINSSLFLRVRNSEITENDKLEIQSYFREKYRIFVNNRKLPLNFKNYKVHAQENVLSIEFSENRVSLKKGDEIYIENELLFDEFYYQQSNWVTLRIPPFLPQYSFESKIEKFAYSHKL